MAGIFKAYDIRGSYPEELDEKTAAKVGFAFVHLLQARRIVMGRDMRLSSPVLARSFCRGARAAGVSVTDIGLTSTPMLYFAIIDGRFDGGAMITASHLPGNMNGFKLCRKEAIPLSGEQGLPALEKLVREASPEEEPAPQSAYQETRIMAQYIDGLAPFVHQPQALKIVVDAGNGTSGPEVSLLMQRFPAWQLIPMCMEPDGRFPHHVANPLLPENTADLQSRVRETGADLGVAFDGDADRCGFIDERAERVPNDLVTALIAEFLLARQPGATILYDLRSSRIVPEVIRQAGGKPVRSRVGHAFIKARMRQVNALYAGELSGHFYYRYSGFTDNALLTMIHMLNLLAWKEAPLSTLVQPLKRYSASGEINLKVRNPAALVAALEADDPDARKDYLDGLTVQYESWWFNLRPSNTEPVARLNIEADDPRLLEEKKGQLLDRLRRIDPSLIVE